ncbi:ferredoxin [Actinocorallia aurantiaca]|uniref:4Fe-4S ferredoxin-type domain-containing protein n=1 Tax=Actinocorallia aurantiaca TaxID=46204 RepID=A0ABN3U3T9_9ACTN
MVRLHADPDRCRGTGQCVFVAPDLFDQDDGPEYKVIILDPEPASSQLLLATRAVLACPNLALTVSDG